MLSGNNPPDRALPLPTRQGQLARPHCFAGTGGIQITSRANFEGSGRRVASGRAPLDGAVPAGRRAPAGVVVGNRPLAERTVARTGALRRNGDFVRRKRTNVGAAGVQGLFASGVSTYSPPLAAPPRWFRALPRADSERRAGPKVESGVLLHSRGQVSGRSSHTSAPASQPAAGTFVTQPAWGSPLNAIPAFLVDLASSAASA